MTNGRRGFGARSKRGPLTPKKPPPPPEEPPEEPPPEPPPEEPE